MLSNILLVTLLMLCRSTFADVACNGNVELCDRLYSNVSQIGTHDSAFVGELLTDSQSKSVAEQLAAGIRFLQAQTHDFLDQVMLCHTNCFLEDSGLLVTYLKTIRVFLDQNPNQVITLLLTNGDGISMSRFDKAMKSAGLKKYAFVPGKQLSTTEWPTLRELIDTNTRLVFFINAGANTTQVPYILPEFDYFFETPYDTTDPDFDQCTLDRPSGSSPDGKMYIVNHFLDIMLPLDILVPDVARANRTNAATGNGSIGAQAALCESIYDRVPNFVLVDYFDKGDVFTAQDNLNGL